MVCEVLCLDFDLNMRFESDKPYSLTFGKAKTMSESGNFISFSRPEVGATELIDRSQKYFEAMNERRSLRFFSDREVPKEVIENLIKTANTAPSGAHKQPWTFVAVSNPQVKTKIREAAEKEEYESYNGRMSEEWLHDLKAFDTDWHKPFLEIAPWLIVVFKQSYRMNNDGSRGLHYYVNESVGLAAGFLLAAIHNAGLVALTHTPSPMNFLQEVLERPANEKPFLLIPVGYPAEDAVVPDLKRKSLYQIAVFFE